MMCVSCSIVNEVFSHLYECAALYGSLQVVRSVEFGTKSLNVQVREDCCCSDRKVPQIDSKSKFAKSSAHQLQISSSVNALSTPTPSSVPELLGQDLYGQHSSAHLEHNFRNLWQQNLRSNSNLLQNQSVNCFHQLRSSTTSITFINYLDFSNYHHSGYCTATSWNSDAQAGCPTTSHAYCISSRSSHLNARLEKVTYRDSTDFPPRAILHEDADLSDHFRSRGFVRTPHNKTSRGCFPPACKYFQQVSAESVKHMEGGGLYLIQWKTSVSVFPDCFTTYKPESRRLYGWTLSGHRRRLVS